MFNNHNEKSNEKRVDNYMKINNETCFDWDDNEDEMGYTTIYNYILDNNNIEFNTQGIYIQIVKFRNSSTHQVYMSSLESIGKGSKRDIQRGILNLRMEGFLIRNVIREQGKFKGYSYKIRRKPIKLTMEQRLEIYNESKVNQEYTRKIYGEDFAKNLEKLSNPCATCNATESTNCVIGNCVIGNCAAYKENRVINKIGKKENTSLPAGEEEDTDNVILIQEIALLELTKAQKKRVKPWDIEKLKTAINLFVIYGGIHFSYLEKCYRNPLQAIRNVKPKVNTFTQMETHGWDLDDLETRASNYMAQTIDYENLSDRARALLANK